MAPKPDAKGMESKRSAVSGQNLKGKNEDDQPKPAATPERVKSEELRVMNFRNPQFFTLNFSLLTSASRTLLLVAMAWAVAADRSAQAGEIHEAVKAGNVAKVKQMLASKPKLVNEGDSQSWTPLHWAAKCGSKEIAAVLLAHNANVTAKAGMTEVQPLHIAAQYGSKEVVELLLEHKADVDTLDRCKRTPLHRAALAGKKGCGGIPAGQRRGC